MIREQIRPAIALTFLLMVITGAVYPGIVTAVAQLLFPWRADGSLIEVDGRVVGSTLIGQRFTGPHYFHPRPSAAGDGYDATASGGTNLGPTSEELARAVEARVESVVQRVGAVPQGVPADMVTASGSGLDPHISPANALLQAERVARARGATVERIRALVEEHTEGRQFGLMGEPRLNVLRLNLAVDREFPARPSR